MSSKLATGNHTSRCPKCGDYVSENRIEKGGLLTRINCPECGWNPTYQV